MDYTKESLTFKLRKLMRYVSLYGPSRTLAKIRSHYHMLRRYESLPEPRIGRRSKAHIGMIGCGKFAYSVIAYSLVRKFGRVIHAAMDTDIHRAASLYERYGLNYYTDDSRKLIDDPAIDLIYIASNHASHASYAIQALKAGKSVHIEKPHVVTDGQLRDLCAAMATSTGRVQLGFNRPQSPLAQHIFSEFSAQLGPAMINWFIAGHQIQPDHWYFKEEEGGRVLGNLCHWIDFVYRLIPVEQRHPIKITPTRWEKSDCDIAVTYVFGEGSVAAISFSAKGHTFEGVKERLSLHRGNLLVTLDDFQVATVEIAERKQRLGTLFRQHGHAESVAKSYYMVRPRNRSEGGADVGYVWGIGNLMLRTRQALEENKVFIVEGTEPDGITDVS